MTAGRPDPEVVRRHLIALREALANLRKHGGVTAQRLRADTDLRWMIERGLQLCTQNALDIATHIVAGSGRDAADYAAAIDRLAELGVIPADFAARLRRIAGFRNVLVHGYLQLDLAIVENVLRDGLADLERFGGHIDAFLNART
jgi:uncharacterized protein YutE (UPF0331/DUF86 family)